MIRPIEVNLAGRVAVVTGANTGIGKEIARDLARLNARVILACRNEARGRAAVDEIVSDTGNFKTELQVVDLSSRASIAAFGAALRARETELHILVNNAGAWFDDRRTSVDGVELTWATNQLGLFALTRELLPLLEAGGRPSQASRIVNVASELARSLDLSDVQFQRRAYDGMTAYAQTKQANRMTTWAQARRLLGRRVTANAMHPGWVATELTTREKNVKGAVASMGAKIFGRAPAEGADTATWLAASTELEGATGRFYVDRRERECRFRGEPQEEALWTFCERMLAAPSQSTSSTTFPKPSLLAT